MVDESAVLEDANVGVLSLIELMWQHGLIQVNGPILNDLIVREPNVNTCKFK
jgi:hypothetical protein